MVRFIVVHNDKYILGSFLKIVKKPQDKYKHKMSG